MEDITTIVVIEPKNKKSYHNESGSKSKHQGLPQLLRVVESKSAP
jgi:hypothetical protein